MADICSARERYMKSAISWTDAHWEPVLGCSPAGAGCANCWAERMTWRIAGKESLFARYNGLTTAVGMRPRWTGVVRTDHSVLAQPIRLRKASRIFVCSRADLFHADVPFEFLDQVFGVMAACRYIGRGEDAFPGHTFQLLTKRPGRAREYLSTDRRAAWAHWSAHYGGGRNPDGIYDQTASGPRELPHVWILASASTQREVDVTTQELLSTTAAVRGMSLEPLLERVNIHRCMEDGSQCECKLSEPRGSRCEGKGTNGLVRCNAGFQHLNWVIVGGESGPGARPCNVEWIRFVVNQCKAAGVACFVKQLGANPIIGNDKEDEDAWPGCTIPLSEDYEPTYQGEMAPLRLVDRKGADPSEWPKDLRVRQMPEVSHAC
jgi:protein gp37